MASDQGSGVRFQLVVQAGPRAGEVIPIDRPRLTIGRQTANDVVLADEEVSRRHARLEQDGADLVLWDEGSSNGTQVNGVAVVGPTLLRPGDVVGLGTSRLLVQALATPVSEERATASTLPGLRLEELSSAAPPEPPPPPSPPPVGALPARTDRITSPPAVEPSPVAEPLAVADPPPAVGAQRLVAAGPLPLPSPEVRAGFGSRLIAYLIDGVILSAVSLVVTRPLIPSSPPSQNPTEAEVAAFMTAVFAAIGLSVVVSLLYTVGGWVVAGATVGKKLLGLRVVNGSGQKPTVIQALIRYLGYFLSSFLYLGFLWILGSEKRGWHDLLAGTYVVRRRDYPPPGYGS
jgi:uncharacterized RDD family membrane protein YckC